MVCKTVAMAARVALSALFILCQLLKVPYVITNTCKLTTKLMAGSTSRQFINCPAILDKNPFRQAATLHGLFGHSFGFPRAGRAAPKNSQTKPVYYRHTYYCTWRFAHHTIFLRFLEINPLPIIYCA